MVGIFGDDNSGSGERAYQPYYNLQDGAGEQQPSAVYANLQDGAGEQLIWPSGPAADVVDNFEATVYENQGKTLADNYTNVSSAGVSRQTTTVKEGSYAITGSTISMIRSTTGLQQYPSAGDTFEYWAYRTTGGAPTMLFGVQADSGDRNMYEIAIVDTYYYELRVWVNNSASFIASNSGDPPVGEWLRSHINWATDGTITCTLYDAAGTQLAQISGTDTTYTSGGIGWVMDDADGSTTYQDDLRIV